MIIPAGMPAARILLFAALFMVLSSCAGTPASGKNTTFRDTGYPATADLEGSTDVVGESPVTGNDNEPEPEPFTEELFHISVGRQVDDILSGMTLRQKIGQLLIIELWDPVAAAPVQFLNDSVRKNFRDVQPGGVLLFGPNIDTAAQTELLTRELQKEADLPLIISTDQEGGAISRLLSSGRIAASRLPAPSDIGVTGSIEIAALSGWIAGRELNELGINMDFAPLADVLENSGNRIIGTRSFGNDPEEVTQLSLAFADGLTAAGIVPVMKHFPGHGHSAGDPHKESVSSLQQWEEMAESSLVPFIRGIEESIPCIMTAHVGMVSLTGTDLPSSLSAYINDIILRQDLGFTGVIITDAMVMGAVSSRWTPEESAVIAVQAGADLLLQPAKPAATITALEEAVCQGRIPETRIDGSVRRILRMKIEAGIIPASDIRVTEYLEESGKEERRAVTEYALKAADMEEAPEDDETVIGSLFHARLVNYIYRQIEKAYQSM